MKKETITKDDGRLLTYYWFDHDTECPSDEDADTGRSCCGPSGRSTLPTTHQSESSAS